MILLYVAMNYVITTLKNYLVMTGYTITNHKKWGFHCSFFHSSLWQNKDSKGISTRKYFIYHIMQLVLFSFKKWAKFSRLFPDTFRCSLILFFKPKERAARIKETMKRNSSRFFLTCQAPFFFTNFEVFSHKICLSSHKKIQSDEFFLYFMFYCQNEGC